MIPRIISSRDMAPIFHCKGALQYLSRYSSNFVEIWYADANFDSDDGRVTKKSKFHKYKMADGCHLENLLKTRTQLYNFRCFVCYITQVALTQCVELVRFLTLTYGN